jgi:paraquat-inducible protein B
MNEKINDPSATNTIPEAEVDTGRQAISIVWLIPLVALIIGAWLGYRAWSETGPTISIEFKNAEGMEAGKTKIKYKDVEVGEVETIEIKEDLSGVTATASIVPGASKFMRKNTRFWVVRPRIAAGEVSGLSTLLSGAYIAIDPSDKGDKTSKFVALEHPPAITTNVPGTYYRLSADTLGSLERGSPVYYRRFKVGQVVDYDLREDGKAVDLRIFVYAPFDRFVKTETVFWNVSGIAAELSAEGINIHLESLAALALGGIAFDTRGARPDAELAGADTKFRLFEDKAASQEKHYDIIERAVMYFTGSVRGLSPGASVEFRGIKIGEVVDVTLEYDAALDTLRIPVVVEIQPERIALLDKEREVGTVSNIADTIVNKGLKAQLKTGNMLTGQLYVDLEFYPDLPKPDQLSLVNGVPVVPTIPATLEAATGTVRSILRKVNSIPFDQIGDNLNRTLEATARIAGSADMQNALMDLSTTLKQLEGLVREMKATTVPALSGTLQQAESAMNGLDKMLSEESPFRSDLDRAVREFAEAARSIRVMADYLERHPEALIRGKGNVK